VLCFTKTLTKQAFEAVSANRFGYLLARYRKSQPRANSRFFTDENRYAGIRATEVALKDLLKLTSTR